MLDLWPDFEEPEQRRDGDWFERHAGWLVPVIVAIAIGIAAAGIFRYFVPLAHAQDPSREPVPGRVICSEGYCTLTKVDFDHLMGRAAACHWPGDG